MNTYEEIVKKLIEKNKKISSMESCTGGAFANTLTCVSGSSEVFNYGAVTYSNEYKIKMGVDSSIIDKYTVYSIETAKEMARAITSFTTSNYGVGITGQMNRQDPSNPYGSVGEVFISIYNKDIDKYYEYSIKINKDTRVENKKEVVDFIGLKLLEVFDIDNL